MLKSFLLHSACALLVSACTSREEQTYALRLAARRRLAHQRYTIPPEIQKSNHQSHRSLIFETDGADGGKWTDNQWKAKWRGWIAVHDPTNLFPFPLFFWFISALVVFLSGGAYLYFLGIHHLISMSNASGYWHYAVLGITVCTMGASWATWHCLLDNKP